MLGGEVAPEAAPATVMRPIAAHGPTPTPPSVRSVLVEGPVGSGAPQVAIRTCTALQVPIAARPTAATTAAIRGLPPSLIGAVPTPVGLTPPALVLAIPSA